MDADADGISGGFRRVANRAAVLAQVCRDRRQFFSGLHFCSLGFRRVADRLSEFPRPRLISPARLQVIDGERRLLDGFQAGRRLELARRWVIDFDPAASRGPGRRVLRDQIQLFDPLPWMAQHFSDVADPWSSLKNLDLTEPNTDF